MSLTSAQWRLLNRIASRESVCGVCAATLLRKQDATEADLARLARDGLVLGRIGGRTVNVQKVLGVSSDPRVLAALSIHPSDLGRGEVVRDDENVIRLFLSEQPEYRSTPHDVMMETGASIRRVVGMRRRGQVEASAVHVVLTPRGEEYLPR